MEIPTPCKDCGERVYSNIPHRCSLKTDKVTRVEVIDQEGRSYVNWDENSKVEIQFQDEGKTLKIFIKLWEK